MNKKYGGDQKLNYYININEFINIAKYKYFLKNIYKNLLFEKNIYDIPILKNKNMCNCNIDNLTNIKFLTSGSNDIYIAEIKKTCTSNSTFFNNNINNIILKLCKGEDDDDEFECLYSNELVTSILYSELVINNITSNLLLLYGYMNNCNLKYNDLKILDNNKNESVIFSSYVNGIVLKELKKKLTIRQVFELIYTIICCYASYGYCISDINLENFMTNKDVFHTCITIKDTIFYFESFESICIIDYQTVNIYEKFVNITKYIYAVANLLDTNIKNDLLTIKNGDYNFVMDQFIKLDCFQEYIVPNKKNCNNYRDIKFKVIDSSKLSSSKQSPKSPKSTSSKQSPKSPKSTSSKQSPKSTSSKQSPKSPKSTSSKQSPKSPKSTSSKQSPKSPKSTSSKQSPKSPKSTSSKQSPKSPKSTSSKQSPKSL